MAKQRPKVLHMDDDPDHQALVRAALSHYGDYDVVCAGDGLEGLAMARAEDPDVILMDLMMPELDGLSVMARMQADNDLRGIPVVFLTARALHTDIERGMAAGARAYVTKPFDALRLAERLADILNGPAELAAAI
ncbi:response regulator [Candidatus Poribacteria bacterium]|jgi:CheY-like chemotaxis protein|nr:response regulator [Candidatus Poribacteria bacterium]MBT7098235.1 response regulator [Candidatus Poribacteria bacterium]MBT7806516.1 response regulator [Candidatus Poribacteria bacterium]